MLRRIIIPLTSIREIRFLACLPLHTRGLPFPRHTVIGRNCPLEAKFDQQQRVGIGQYYRSLGSSPLAMARSLRTSEFVGMLFCCSFVEQVVLSADYIVFIA